MTHPTPLPSMWSFGEIGMIKESAQSHLKCNFVPEMVWGETFNLKCFKKCWKNIRFYDIQNGLQVYMKILTQAGFFFK